MTATFSWLASKKEVDSDLKLGAYMYLQPLKDILGGEIHPKKLIHE